MERQAERAQSTPRRSTSASLGGAGNPVALLMRVRKAAKTMEKRARVRKSTVEQNQPELLGEVSHLNTYIGYGKVYVCFILEVPIDTQSTTACCMVLPE